MRVEFLSYLRNITNCSHYDVPAVPTAGDLIRVLGEIYGPALTGKILASDGELGAEAVILINGRHLVHLGGIDAPLKDDDIVRIFPVVTGG